ncbi:MAG: iron uptake porin [Xenococcaceae cyanobacterium MO_188.B32]|nr:iron uptake porin [Xenococcaceae cyanobacterium MO_188.B32]
MSKQAQLSRLSSSALLGTAILTSAAPVVAEEINLEKDQKQRVTHEQILKYSEPLTENGTDVNLGSMEQVTNVNQLRDVSPTDWAYEALRSLVDRYGCIVGYPNQTYRGTQALSRYEFAAGLNACLNQIERLIAASEAIAREDLDTLQRLTQEFEAELATLSGRVDNLESRTAFLEDNSFSTTTKLAGEVAFTLAQAFGEDVDSQVVFTDRVRLQLVSSFTGKDKLFTRLTAGNIGNSFQDETGTREGRFAFDGQANNDVVIDRLHYVFPLFDDKLKVTAMASLAAHHFYAEVFNDRLNVGGGANGALTRFAERSPIYRQGIDRRSAGIGFNFSPIEKFEISAGYIAPNGSDPSEGNGLFNGSYSAMGQIAFKPTDTIRVGATYVRGYDTSPFRGSFLWGGTGTNLGNLRLTAANGLTIGGVPANLADNPVITNSFGGAFQWDVNPKISFRGWFSYTDADLEEGEATILNYAGALVFPDLGKEGNLGAVVVGAEPYLDDLDLDAGEADFPDDIPLHVEAFYKYQLTDNISVTPGVVWLVNPNQSDNNDDIFIGALRTTFTF